MTSRTVRSWVRWAEETIARWGMPNSSRTAAAFAMTAQSESEPMKMTTSGLPRARRAEEVLAFIPGF